MAFVISGKIKACALKLVSVLLVDGQGNEGHKDEIVQGALWSDVSLMSMIFKTGAKRVKLILDNYYIFMCTILCCEIKLTKCSHIILL